MRAKQKIEKTIEIPNFDKKLKTYLKISGHKITKIANMLNVSRETIYTWLNGTHNPAYSRVVELSKKSRIHISRWLDVYDFFEDLLNKKDLNDIYNSMDENSNKNNIEFYLQLAKIYKENYGDYHNAYLNFESALKISTQEYGEKSTITNDIINLISTVSFSNDKLDLLIQAKETYIKEFGNENHISVGVTNNNIGLAYSKRKEYNKALEYYLIAEEIYKICYDPSEAIIKTRMNIAVSHLNLKNYDKAIILFHKNLKRAKKYYGNHFLIPNIYYNMASACFEKYLNTFKQLDNRDEKNKRYLVKLSNRVYNHLKKSEKLYKMIQGNESYKLSLVYIMLGRFYQELDIKNKKKALNYYKRALKIIKKTSPSNKMIQGLENLIKTPI